MRYQFTGDNPIVAGEFSHGRNATVERATRPDALDDVDGSTIVLYPGDVLVTDDPVAHSQLVPLDDAPGVRSPYDRMLKPELVATATERGLDADGTAPDLRARLLEHDRAIADGAPPVSGSQPNEAPDGQSAAPEILSPQTGAEQTDAEPGAGDIDEPEGDRS